MVHNGIEYADMQLLAESYQLLREVGGFSASDLAKTFECWNSGPLESYLVEISYKIFQKNDEDGQPLVEKILDKAGQKGTGRWTAQVALELGVAIPMICEAVNARILSSRKKKRVRASELRVQPVSEKIDSEVLASKLENALVCAKVIAYAQGLKLIQVASKDFNWDVDISEVARIWKGGCIIRAKLLDNIQSAFKNNPNLDNLLLQPDIQALVNPRIADLRDVVSMSAQSGIPALCFSSALSYFDSYFTASLPQNLTQAQRDFFGAHTYQRIDRDGVFHSEWDS